MLASADVFRTTEGRVDTPREAGREELAGVRERGMHTGGLPRNLGDLVVSAHESREGHPVEQPRPGGGALAAAGSEGRAPARYRQAKETKCGGTGGQETEHSVVCAGQRAGQEGLSPSGARMRGAVSKSGGNASLAGESGRYGEAVPGPGRCMPIPGPQRCAGASRIRFVSELDVACR